MDRYVGKGRDGILVIRPLLHPLCIKHTALGYYIFPEANLRLLQVLTT